jgi:hypothetical protein
MGRTTPTNVRAKHVKRGDSLTNLTGTVASVTTEGREVLITMSDGDRFYRGVNEMVTVNRP